NSVLIDREILKSICKIVMDRSAKIVATLIVGIILKIDRELNRTHIVAIDGTLYEKATWYKDKLRENIDNLLGEKRDKIKLKLTKDGSGKGAAVAAATAIINQQK
nr:hexokinase [Caldisericia bacterium]